MPSTEEYKSLFIGGDWIAPATGKVIGVTSASTAQPIGEVPEAVEDDVDRAVEAARAAFTDPGGWAHWDAERRAEALLRLADALESRGPETARRVSAQNGMPIAVADFYEAQVPARLLRYYAGMIRESPSEESRPGLLREPTLVRRKPVGVVAAVTPWNFPQTLAFFKIAPALAAGCTVVLKPSPETVLDSFLLAEAVRQAGLPQGVINIVPGGRDIGAYLVAHPGVDKVSFTGSTRAGRHIASVCGQLLRPVTLELGGKSAAVILDDADLDGHLEEMFAASLLNNGQTCYASTRILAPRSRYDEVVDLYTTLLREATVGDPLDPATRVGPLVSPAQRERVEGFIARGKAGGARLTTGGGRPSGLDGWFVEPTVFADVDPSSEIAQEEIFGPVLTVIRYEDEADAIRIANDSAYGLGGTVWGGDPDHNLAVARQIDTGTIGINGYGIDAVAPYGGMKQSGLGRELGPEGLAAFQEFATVYRP
ncbi:MULTISPECIES: aldehyde dehydrogenase [unclassified Streptomyces]|uniref:aldehyde dehydrogenase n=1 Tax=unclassified Streptomyces TaxID=2593676 RepID=UPI0036E58594